MQRLYVAVSRVFVLRVAPAKGFGYTDCRANNLDGFDFRQIPRTFTPIKAKYPPSTFTRGKPAVPPDTE
jgi:hypothetical protein